MSTDTFRGDYKDNDPLQRLLDREETFPRWYVDEIVDEIESDLRTKGYLKAEVKVKRRIDQSGSETIELVTDKGRRYHLIDPEWIGVSDKIAVEHFFQRIGKIQPGEPFREEDYKRIVREELARKMVANGYLDLRLGSVDFVTDDKRAVVKPVIYLSEGPVYMLKSAALTGIPADLGNRQEAKDLRNALLIGKPFDVGKVDDRQKQLARALVALGYLDAKVDREQNKGTDGISVQIKVNPGPRYKVAKVLIRGAIKTHYTVMKREVLLGKGEFFEEERIRDSVAQILRLEIARNVDIQVLEKDPETGEVYVLVDVEESARFRFEIGPGFGTVQGVRGIFRGTYANIGGTARRFTLYARANRRLTGETPSPNDVVNVHSFPFIERRITVEYFEPSLLNYHIDGRLTYSHAKEYQTRFSIFSNTFVAVVDYRLTRRWIFTTMYDFELSEPFNIDKNVQIQDSIDPSEKRLTAIGEGILMNYLDEDFNPLRGVRAKVDGNLFNKYFGGEFNFWQTTFRQEFFYPLWVFHKGKWLGLALTTNFGFSGAYGKTQEVPVEKRLYVGGENSVRGFDEKSINPLYICNVQTGALCTQQNGGDSFFSFMTEINVPLFYGLDLLGFLDGGNAYNSDRNFKPWDLRYGAGAGLRLNSPVGPLKSGYGFNLERKRIDGNLEPVGAIYIGVGPI